MFERVRASIEHEVNRIKQRLVRQTLFGVGAAACGLTAIGFGIGAAYMALAARIGGPEAALVIAGILLLLAVGCGLAMNSGGGESHPVDLAQDFRQDLQDEVRYLGDQARAQVRAVAGYAKSTAQETVSDVASQVKGAARNTVNDVASQVKGAARSAVQEAAGTVEGVVRSVADELPGPVREAFLIGTRALPHMAPWQLALVAAAAGYFYARRTRRRAY
jgi:hypothetical protein